MRAAAAAGVLFAAAVAAAQDLEREAADAAAPFHGRSSLLTAAADPDGWKYGLPTRPGRMRSSALSAIRRTAPETFARAVSSSETVFDALTGGGFSAGQIGKLAALAIEELEFDEVLRFTEIDPLHLPIVLTVEQDRIISDVIGRVRARADVAGDPDTLGLVDNAHAAFRAAKAKEPPRCVVR